MRLYFEDMKRVPNADTCPPPADGPKDIFEIASKHCSTAAGFVRRAFRFQSSLQAKLPPLIDGTDQKV
jgi:hypothetical protein